MRALLAAVALLIAATAASAAGQAEPRCFGAAARDPERPCVNPALATRVTPTPNQAQLTPNLACALGADQATGGCDYGVPKRRATASVAMLGDSHAAHWRAALQVVAKRLDWHVAEFAPPHCSFSASVPDQGEQVAQTCPTFRQNTLDYLTAHPEIGTVFVSAHARGPIVVPPGETAYAARVRGYVQQWAKLPATVTRIVVLRDVPEDRVGTFECVRGAMRRGEDAGVACRIPRERALRRDAEVTAARRSDRNASVIDLSRQFCDARSCFPVVGGVLVHKDQDHLGQLFARTLGPILLREIRATLRGD